MATIPIPNGVTIEMVYAFSSLRMENVYRVSKGAPATLGDLQALWTIARDWEQNTARHQRSNAASLILISVTANDGSGAPVHEAGVVPAIQGAINGGHVPAFVTTAVKHTTGKQGRSFRGRSYWVGISNLGFVTADTLSSAYANALAACYDDFRARLLAAGWQFCVASLYSGVAANGKAIPRAAGILSPITASACEVGIDTNRHRKIPFQV